MAYVYDHQDPGLSAEHFPGDGCPYNQLQRGNGEGPVQGQEKAVRQILLCLLLALAVSLSTELIFRTGLGAKLPKGTVF